MEHQLVARLTTALHALPIVDPHSHIEPHSPVATTLDDLLGYHYYTELAHTIGADRKQLTPETDPRERSRYLFDHLPRLENTVQYSWLLEICQTFFGWQGDQLTPNDFEAVWRLAENKLKQPDWEQHIWQQTNLQQIYLTNEFDDPLIGFKTDSYIPCLRVDTLVNTAHEPATLERLRHASGHVVNTVGQLHNAIASLVQQFRNKGARACAISLPSRFRYQLNTSDRLPATAPLLNLTPTQQVTLKAQVFHAIAEQCNVHGLPFDLMIGVQRNVYPSGVYQGQDLMDEPGSLLHYAELFNSFPDVKFCVSVLTSQQNQELASYSWIFPNVYTSGHWWYSNVPTLIEQDLRLRLQAVPVEKQIGYYSDAYKLEFVLPKFNMYRRILAKVLAEDYVLARHWPEERAVALGEQLLVGNIHSIFGN